jgi:electron transfer flavoprotein alpha subunit
MSETQTESGKRKIELEEVDFRGDNHGIFTWTELVDGAILDVSKEILGEGTKLKEKLKTTIGSVVLGDSSKIDFQALAKELIAHGADKVAIVDNKDLAEFSTRAYTEALEQVIKKQKPEIFLFGATTLGRDLAPRLAARLGVGLSADCTEFDIGEFKSIPRKQYFKEVAHFIRPSYGESKLATIIGPWTFPQMGTARPGSMTPLEFNTNRLGTIEEFSVTISESELQVKILETNRADASGDSSSSDLLQAQIVVAGGYGVGKDGFAVLQELVDALNSTGHKAALGASRKAVDAGFVDYPKQVGQTGKTIRPQYYLAVGISGAIQHLAGMKYAKKVIAINKDNSAPIFEHADFGMVGRFEDIIPEFIKAVKSGKKFPAIVGSA